MAVGAAGGQRVTTCTQSMPPAQQSAATAAVAGVACSTARTTPLNVGRQRAGWRRSPDHRAHIGIAIDETQLRPEPVPTNSP